MLPQRGVGGHLAPAFWNFHNFGHLLADVGLLDELQSTEDAKVMCSIATDYKPRFLLHRQSSSQSFSGLKPNAEKRSALYVNRLAIESFAVF